MKTGGIRRLTPMGDTPYKNGYLLTLVIATATTTHLAIAKFVF